MQELKEKLCKIDEETDWLRIMKEAGSPEVQIQIRAEIDRAIKRLDKAIKKKNKMSSFYCEKCGALCSDSEIGYTTGCEHYPADIDKNGHFIKMSNKEKK